MLSTHLHPSLLSSLFPSDFPTNNLYTVFVSLIHATFPAHLILLDFIILSILGKEYKSCSSLLYSFLHPPITSSLFIFSPVLYSQTPSVSVLPLMSETEFHTHTEPIVLYILIYTCFERRREDRRFCIEQALPEISLLLNSS
jgi:hypothetical protein